MLVLFCWVSVTTGENPYATVSAIPLPAGYHRVNAGNGSFAAWLRTIPLKKNLTVFLYDGSPKRNQDAQFAVLDVSVGREDLQQCADAVMRLRAEYLYSRYDYSSIDFYTEQGVRLNFALWAKARKIDLSDDRVAAHRRTVFDAFLRTVFSYCSTRTLQRQLIPAASFAAIEAGDVLIRGGSPGHAMLVIDVAEDVQGHRIYLLAQSYMPAQDIHIVKDPSDAGLNPWYSANPPDGQVLTPEYEFKINELRKWPK